MKSLYEEFSGTHRKEKVVLLSNKKEYFLEYESITGSHIHGICPYGQKIWKNFFR